MKNSWSFSSPAAKSKLVYLLIVLAVIGLADATYLAAKHYSAQEVGCSLVAGCEIVLTSQYALLWGIPVAVYGLVYYGGLFLMLSYFTLLGKSVFWKLFALGVTLGFIVTIYLVYLQINVINAICQFCMVSAITTTLMFAFMVGASAKRVNVADSGNTPIQQ